MKNLIKKASITRLLLYALLILSMASIGVSFAQYATRDSFDDAARIANVNVSISHSLKEEFGEVSKVDEVDGTKEYIITVTNNGETPMRVRLVVVGTYIVSTDCDGWFELEAQGGFRDITITITGIYEGNKVRIYAEYEQINQAS